MTGMWVDAGCTHAFCPGGSGAGDRWLEAARMANNRKTGWIC